MKSKRLMSVDISNAVISFSVKDFDSLGKSKQVARGWVKSRGWLTRKIKQFSPHQVICHTNKETVLNATRGIDRWIHMGMARPWSSMLAMKNAPTVTMSGFKGKNKKHNGAWNEEECLVSDSGDIKMKLTRHAKTL